MYSPKNGTTAPQHSKNSAVGIWSPSLSTKSSNFFGTLEKNVSMNLSLDLCSLGGTLFPTRAGGEGDGGGDDEGVTKKSELVRRWVMSEEVVVVLLLAPLLVVVSSSTDCGMDCESGTSSERVSWDSESGLSSGPVPVI